MKFGNPPVPRRQFSVRAWQFVMAGKEKVGEHAVEIEIHKQGTVREEKRALQQALFVRNKGLLQLLQKDLLLVAPAGEATPAKFPFLVADKSKPIRRRDKFLPINIVQLKARPFHRVLDVHPKNRLDALPGGRKQSKLEFLVEKFCDILGIIPGLEYNDALIADHGDRVVLFSRDFPDQRSVAIGNVGDFEGEARVFEDAALNDAECAPGKLNQFNHASERVELKKNA